MVDLADRAGEACDELLEAATSLLSLSEGIFVRQALARDLGSKFCMLSVETSF